MKISLIVAAADNGVIGERGTLLPWILSTDMARFKQLTMGHPIIMGRKTYDTIGRSLPGRLNIVISRNPGFQAEGCETAASVDAAIRSAERTGAQEAFVIGGGTIYAAAEPLADTIYLTRVHASPKGDTYFRYPEDRWQQGESEAHSADDKNQYDYEFLTLDRKNRA